MMLKFQLANLSMKIEWGGNVVKPKNVKILNRSVDNPEDVYKVACPTCGEIFEWTSSSNWGDETCPHCGQYLSWEEVKNS